jgi:death-on-curing protein
MKETFYPTLEEALYLHDILMQRFGGTRGVVDCGLLESELARPRSGYYSSVSEQAAALMQSLAMNHPFVDGNKRVAFALTAVFLRINGLKLTVPAKDGVQFVEQTLIAEKASLAAITDWIEKHTR